MKKEKDRGEREGGIKERKKESERGKIVVSEAKRYFTDEETEGKEDLQREK